MASISSLSLTVVCTVYGETGAGRNTFYFFPNFSSPMHHIFILVVYNYEVRCWLDIDKNLLIGNVFFEQ